MLRAFSNTPLGLKASAKRCTVVSQVPRKVLCSSARGGLWEAHASREQLKKSTETQLSAPDRSESCHTRGAGLVCVLRGVFHFSWATLVHRINRYLSFLRLSCRPRSTVLVALMTRSHSSGGASSCLFAINRLSRKWTLSLRWADGARPRPTLSHGCVRFGF